MGNKLKPGYVIVLLIISSVQIMLFELVECQKILYMDDTFLLLVLHILMLRVFTCNFFKAHCII